MEIIGAILVMMFGLSIFLYAPLMAFYQSVMKNRTEYYSTERSMNNAGRSSLNFSHVVMTFSILISIMLVKWRPEFIRRIQGAGFLFLYPAIAVLLYCGVYYLSEIYFRLNRKKYSDILEKVHFSDDDLLVMAGYHGFFLGGSQIISAYVQGILSRQEPMAKYGKYLKCVINKKALERIASSKINDRTGQNALCNEKSTQEEGRIHFPTVIKYIKHVNEKDEQAENITFSTDYFLLLHDKFKVHKLPVEWITILTTIRSFMNCFYASMHFLILSLGITKFILGIENNKAVGFLAIEILLYAFFILFGQFSNHQKNDFKDILIKEVIIPAEIERYKKAVEEYERGKSEEELSLDKTHMEKKLLRQYCFYVHNRTVETGNDYSLPAGVSYEIRTAHERLVDEVKNRQRQQSSSGCSSCGSCSSCSSCSSCGGCGGCGSD